jgi:glycosyltransferase involved in cell wall biosynthesis
LRYAIISMPRDRVSAGLEDASSLAIISMHLARRLAPRHDVRIVASRARGQPRAERLGPGIDCRRVGIPLSRLHKYRELAAAVFEDVTPHASSSAYFLDYFWNAARALRDFDPDVIHIQVVGQSAALFRRLFPRARIVVHVHDTSPARVPAATAARMLGRADLIVTCSEYVARTLRAELPALTRPIVAIDNGVDVQRFVPRQRRARDPERRFGLVYLGRLSPEKGVHVLIDAFNAAIARDPRLELALIGSPAMYSYAEVKLFHADPHWAALRHFYGDNPWQRFRRQFHRPGQRYADALRAMQTPAARAATRFAGAMPHAEVAAALAGADALVAPSVCDEPFGMPVVEAMAAALPVIASNAGGMGDLVDPGRTGLLVPRSDAAALAAAIVELAADPRRCESMGDAGRQRAEQAFTWDAMVARLSAALAAIGVAL